VTLARMIKGTIFSGVAGTERLFRSSDAQDLSKVNNFLLLQHSTALGTAVHATPLVAALRASVPNCRIVVAASGLAIEVFRNNPGIDHLIETPSPLRNFRAAAKSLRAQKPFAGKVFAALTTCGNERTLVGLQALLSGAALRVGFTEVPQLYRVALERDVELSLIDNNLRIVKAFGYLVQHCEPQIFVTEADVASARTFLTETGAHTGRPVAIFVTQNSGGQRTGWHLDRFVRVIRHASGELGCAVVYVGTARDAESIAAIREAAGGIGVSIAGKTSVTELTAVLAMSDVMVTLDTGTMHVGRAAKVPMVVLGPSWQKPLEWLPLTVANVRILRGPDREAIPDNYQLDEISAESVIAALDELLLTYPPSAADRSSRVASTLA
jgi:ADP-heptose:LPS heptosyltransferase